MKATLASVSVLLGLFSAQTFGQVRVDLARLPEQIKALHWRDIDPGAAGPLERCRALSLLADFLDEIDAQLTAEADLLSEYIDAKDLGPDFAGQPPVVDPTALTLADSHKVAIAMLRGPMAYSAYAKSLADTDPDSLRAYETLYTSTCQRRWAEMVDSRLQTRSMTRFLVSREKLADYRAWVPAEVAKRAEEQKAEMARRRAAAVANQQDERQKRLDKLDEQRQKEEQEREQAAQQMQQALAAAQSQNVPSDAGTVVYNDDYPSWYYGGVTPLGWSWYRNNGYRGDAGARVEHRMSGWRGARGARGGGGGRRR